MVHLGISFEVPIGSRKFCPASSTSALADLLSDACLGEGGIWWSRWSGRKKYVVEMLSQLQLPSYTIVIPLLYLCYTSISLAPVLKYVEILESSLYLKMIWCSKMRFFYHHRDEKLTLYGLIPSSPAGRHMGLSQLMFLKLIPRIYIYGVLCTLMPFQTGVSLKHEMTSPSQNQASQHFQRSPWVVYQPKKEPILAASDYQNYLTAIQTSWNNIQ